MSLTTPPNECATMAELREQIDRLDEMLVGLLATRSGYIDRAITLKRQEGIPARAEGRVREVLARVRARAAERGLDEGLAETLWTEIIEWSIRREAVHLDG